MSAEIQDRAVPAPVYGGIFLCSLAVLMEEVLLTRIFSFTIWYHLAYLTISTALLGFGAAGSMLTIFPRLWQSAPQRVAGCCAVAAGVTLLISLSILAPRPIDPNIMLVHPYRFFLGLLGYSIAVTIPFFFAGLAIATPLAAYPHRVSRLYGADLLGAGLGCLAAVFALTKLDAPGAVTVCAAVFIAAGALYLVPRWTAALAAALASGLRSGSLLPVSSSSLCRPRRSKSAESFAIPAHRHLFTQWSPVNRVDLCRQANPKYSWWALVGRSKKFTGTTPEVLDIQYDGHNGSNIHHIEGPHSLDMLQTHLLRTPYLLRQKPRVLVIGVGGGIDVINAVWQGATHVTGAELQPITVGLLKGPLLADWTGGIFNRPKVELVASEGRHYVRSHDDRYDILQITAVDTFSAQTTGAYVLAESYLYTVEAFAGLSVAFDRRRRVVDCRWATSSVPASVPPAHSRTACARGAGSPAPPRRGRPTVPTSCSSGTNRQIGPGPDLLVKRSPFTPDEVRRVQQFATENGFVVRLTPETVTSHGGTGNTPGSEREAATDSVGNSPIARLMHAPDAELERLLRETDYAVGPITDDCPFFFHSLKWSGVFAGFVTARKEFWFYPGSLTGQLLLLMMLGQAVLLGAVLILLPLARRGLGQLPLSMTFGFLAYFLGLGLGFLMIEISFVQKYVLVLGYPTYSLSVTVCSLLVSAAAGAALSRRGWSRPQRFLGLLLAATIALVVLEGAALPVLREHVLAASLTIRIAVTVLLQFPLGMALGMYFPTGLELLHRGSRD